MPYTVAKLIRALQDLDHPEMKAVVFVEDIGQSYYVELVQFSEHYVDGAIELVLGDQVP